MRFEIWDSFSDGLTLHRGIFFSELSWVETGHIAETAHHEAHHQAHRHIVCFDHMDAVPYSDWLKSDITLSFDTSVIILLVSGLH